MTIRALHCHVLSYPEPNDFGNTRHTLLVELRTERGVRAWGEALAMWPEACKAVKTLIEQGLGDLVLGMDEAEPERIWQKIKDHTWWYGEGGIASLALSAIDIAAWDAAAQTRGLPLVALLGTRAHDALPALASMHVNRATDEEGAAEVAAHIRAGFRGAKLGFGKRGLSKVGADPDIDLSYLRAVREACGPAAALMADIGNGVRWDLETAVRATRLFEPIGLDWIEEPLHPSQLDELLLLKRAVSTPVATGEREWTVEAYRRLINSGAVDVVGVDPARAEGVTGFRRIAQLVEAAGLTLNAHAWSSAITSAASLHLSLASPSTRWFELKPLENPLQHELVDAPIWHQNGLVRIGDRPGLGLTVRDAVLAKYRVG